MNPIKRMGRPTKYRKRFIKTALNYLEECKNQKKIPFLEELAGRLEVSEDSIKRWTKADEDFCGAIDRIMDHQRMALKVMGLKSPAVIIFLLKANHGMIETEKIQLEGKGDEPLSIIFTDSATWKRAKANRLKQQIAPDSELLVSQKTMDTLAQIKSSIPNN